MLKLLLGNAEFQADDMLMLMFIEIMLILMLYIRKIARAF